MNATPWIDVPQDSGYGLEALPYGAFRVQGGHGAAHLGVRIGDHVLDLMHASDHLDVPMPVRNALRTHNLDALLRLGSHEWHQAREAVRGLLTDPAMGDRLGAAVHPVAAVELALPFTVADYVDFYASEHHASNIGQIFRPDSPALPANWKHLPIGYHGRSGTVVVSGTDVIHPSGQRKGPKDPEPVFGPSIRLDIEAELGFVVGGAARMGHPVAVDHASEHLFGVVILNDWSARDIQAWEYVPLGPFLGKSFATTISGWVLPMAALREARCDLPGQDEPKLLPYLRGHDVHGLDIHVTVELNGTEVSHPEYREMYYSPTQMLAHMTVNGASLRPGDLFGSGTISGPERESYGSFLELTWNGEHPMKLEDGTEHTFLQPGDTVVMRAWAPGPKGSRVALGECAGTIVEPSRHHR